MDVYLRFENAGVFVQAVVIFLRFSAHNPSLLLRFLLFYFD